MSVGPLRGQVLDHHGYAPLLETTGPRSVLGAFLPIPGGLVSPPDRYNIGRALFKLMTESNESFRPHLIRQRKSDGTFKTRELMIPSDQTRNHHEIMLHSLYQLGIDMPHATGGLPGRRLVDNMMPHRQNDHFYVVDLKDAFQSVDIDQLHRTIEASVPDHDWSNLLKRFVDTWGVAPDVAGLPLGAPCSPYLFNLYCLPMDQAISSFCDERGLAYTRYFDDLTFSSPKPFSKERLRNIRGLIAEHGQGMQLNPKKSRHHSISDGPFYLTGLSLQPDRSIQPSPRLIDAANSVFDDFNGVDPEAIVYDDEIGRVHGWHGVINMLSLVETPTLRSLERKYQRALGRLGDNQS